MGRESAPSFKPGDFVLVRAMVWRVQAGARGVLLHLRTPMHLPPDGGLFVPTCWHACPWPVSVRDCVAETDNS